MFSREQRISVCTALSTETSCYCECNRIKSETAPPLQGSTLSDGCVETRFCRCQGVCWEQSINTRLKHWWCSAGSWRLDQSIQDTVIKQTWDLPAGEVKSLLAFGRSETPRLHLFPVARLGQQRARQRKDEGAAAERALSVSSENRHKENRSEGGKTIQMIYWSENGSTQRETPQGFFHVPWF